MKPLTTRTRLENLKPGRQSIIIFLGAVVLGAFAVVPRLHHFGAVIDDPHSWVQADREYSVWSYYRYGITLLDMRVCVYGGYKSALYEFPLPDVLPAVLYRIFGPEVLFCRLVTLLFFLGAALYLFKVVEILFDRWLALLTVAVYLVLPLGIYYSRAILMHDFAAIFFAHAMVYYYLRACEEDRWDLRILGALFATLGLLVKPPYVFYFFLPLAYYFWRRENIWRLAREAPLYVLPSVPFLAWRAWVFAVNSREPDWFFIPGYRKRDDLGYWFYGPFSMRLDPANWSVVGGRIFWEVLTPVGCGLFLLGLIALRKEPKYRFFLLWIVGAASAILVFFNLNVVHNYYQNPLLAIAAVGIGAGLRTFAPEMRLSLRSAAMSAVLVGFAFVCVRSAEAAYYQIDTPAIFAAQVTAASTPEEALVVCASPYTTKPTDTRILGRAHRAGWALGTRDLSVDLLGRLRGEGASAVVLMRHSAQDDVPRNVLSYLDPYLVGTAQFPDSTLEVSVYRFEPGGDQAGRIDRPSVAPPSEALTRDSSGACPSGDLTADPRLVSGASARVRSGRSSKARPDIRVPARRLQG